MYKIFFILFFITSCGFQSYYADPDTSDSNVESSDTRNQINLTKVIFNLQTNHDRIAKDELLLKMERLDKNETQDYRYILLITTFTKSIQTAFSPTGAMLGMEALFVINYALFDTGKINSKKIDFVEDEEFSDLKSLSQRKFGIRTDQYGIITKDNSQNEANTEYFDQRSDILGKKHKLIYNGSVSYRTQYLVSNILLYGDLIAMENAFDLAAKGAANELFYTLIGMYNGYIKKNYNVTTYERKSGINSIDIFTQRAKDKISLVANDYVSLDAIRERINSLFVSKKEEKMKK